MSFFSPLWPSILHLCISFLLHFLVSHFCHSFFLRFVSQPKDHFVRLSLSHWLHCLKFAIIALQLILKILPLLLSTTCCNSRQQADCYLKFSIRGDWLLPSNRKSKKLRNLCSSAGWDGGLGLKKGIPFTCLSSGVFTTWFRKLRSAMSDLLVLYKRDTVIGEPRTLHNEMIYTSQRPLLVKFNEGSIWRSFSALDSYLEGSVFKSLSRYLLYWLRLFVAFLISRNILGTTLIGSRPHLSKSI
jgi:hypothetical protein